MTQVLRPNGTVVNGGTLTGGATAHAVTSDDSDSSYVKLTDGQKCKLYMATYTLPAGATPSTVTPRIRWRADATTAELQLEINTLGVDIAQSIWSIDTTTITTQTGAPVAMNYTVQNAQSAVNDLRMELTCTDQAARVMECYLDLEYAGSPTVTVLAPTGTVTDTNNPTVQWLFTPGAGYQSALQSQYRVKFFSAAQYGAGGFDPSISTATFDSGVQLGEADDYTGSAILAASGSYRAYVQAAQTINNQVQWSDWAYSGFTMSISPPGTPTVTVTLEDTYGRVKVLIAAGTGTNSLFDLERSDDGGVTWTFVRGATRMTVVGGDVLVYDYEAPFGTAVQYRARGIDTTTGSDLIGAWATSGSYTPSPSSAWLKAPVTPSLNQAVTLAYGGIPTLSRVVNQSVNYVLGRATPVVVTDVRRSSAGKVTFLTLDAASAAALWALLDLGSILLLQTSSAAGWGNRYVVFGDAEERRTEGLAIEPVRYFDATFVEVDRPDDTGMSDVWS